MDKKRYDNKHWKYIDKHMHGVKPISRKTKKALKKHMDEIIEEYEQTEDFRLSELPDCPYCDSGTCRVHEFDSGYTCPDCEGTGKTGWIYKDGKRVPGKQVNHG
ncbi:hypothetical protein [Paenibacillus peoriae]|uniref:hypothetical protein n=1 Tax=Paenibacillus peoriae TaxID=59893 RepID=UPI000979CF3F|nr:hypothetical protein [Paenibacillus peoriae]OMF50845.1 hypothetical protein BK135_00860 [Paenibacillus peoriae]